MNAEERFSLILSIAKRAARRMRSKSVDLDDLTQEATLWLLEHPGRVDRCVLPDGNYYYPQIEAEVITGCLVPYVERESVFFYRRDTEADYRYTPKVVELALPGVFDSQYRPPFLQGDDKVTTTKDPTTVDNWTCFVADVSRAMSVVCSERDKKLLFARSVLHWTFSDCAREWEMSEKTYGMQYRDALSAITTYLNSGIEALAENDGEILDDAVNGPPPTQRADFPILWTAAGRDPYREPDE